MSNRNEGKLTPVTAGSRTSFPHMYGAHIPRLLKRSSSGRSLLPSTAIITGGTGVIGSAIVKQIVRDSPGLYLHVLGRSEEKYKKLAVEWEKEKDESVQIEFHNVDLASKKSINEFIEKFSKKNSILDVLINCAAVAPEKRSVADEEKLELQFVVNVLSYHRLTRGMLPLLNKSLRKGGGRVIYMASKDAKEIEAEDLQFRKREYSNVKAYHQSKGVVRVLTAQSEVMWGPEYKNVSFFCCHPGEVLSPLTKSMGLEAGSNHPAEAAQTPIFLIMDPKLNKDSSGLYFMAKRESHNRFKDYKDAKLLWEIVDKFSQ